MVKKRAITGSLFSLENIAKLITLFIMVVSSSIGGYTWLETKLTRAINKAVDDRLNRTVYKVNQMEIDYKVSERKISAVVYNNVIRDAFNRDVARVIRAKIDREFDKPEEVKFEVEN